MKIILDTEPVVWMLKSEDRFSNRQKEVFHNINNERFISIVSLWEISIKISLIRNDFVLRDDWFKYLKKQMKQFEIKWLNIKQSHCISQTGLPFHHKDPFDRLIISQGITENASIIGTDSNFKLYDVKLI